jgi:hypothetical protein
LTEDLCHRGSQVMKLQNAGGPSILRRCVAAIQDFERFSERRRTLCNFSIPCIDISGVQRIGGRALCIIKPRNRTMVIWEAVTWTEGIALGLISLKSISANRHFRDWKDEGSRTLDIGKQEVLKRKILKRHLNKRRDISDFGKLRDIEISRPGLGARNR